MFVVVGTSNAVNLTDGLDGLAIGPVIINAGTFLILAYMRRHHASTGFNVAEYLEIPHIAGVGRARGLLRRAWSAPASASSGTTPIPRRSSWATSARSRSAAALGMLAVLTKNELTLVILGGVFVVETLSA